MSWWDVSTDPNRYTPRMPAQQHTFTPHHLTPLPVGCICPVGANKECERPDCPRKPFKGAAAMAGSAPA